MVKIKHVLKFIIPKNIREFLLHLKNLLIETYDKCLIPASVKHIYGPEKIEYGENEVIVICTVLNGSVYIKSFIEHYLSLGVKHIVLLDNNSEDDTVSIARDYKNVTILSSKIPASYRCYRVLLLREYLIRRFCRHRWCLVADIDELFDYPFSDSIPITQLLEYLNRNSYTAVLSQMLDMFSNKPLSELKNTKEGPLKELYQYYDISDIKKVSYHSKIFGRLPGKNILADQSIMFHIGGIRKAIFGTDNWLTKHQLIFVEKVRLVHPHWAVDVVCADFSAACYHYKFAGNFYETALRYSNARFGYAVSEYEAIVSKCRGDPSLGLKRATAEKIYSTEDLIKNGFLFVSKNYLEWARRCSERVARSNGSAS
ncbi:MAG: glycosyltransferase family 2 protein [Candidatus Omnitrophica bacterium]|nr:glycosyltransferase family 2 protein [Candidatus Omnitrophota bacterium]